MLANEDLLFFRMISASRMISVLAKVSVYWRILISHFLVAGTAQGLSTKGYFGFVALAHSSPTFCFFIPSSNASGFC